MVQVARRQTCIGLPPCVCYGTYLYRHAVSLSQTTAGNHSIGKTKALMRSKKRISAYTKYGTRISCRIRYLFDVYLLRFCGN